MHQIVSNRVDSSRRWWVLAIVVAAQFMFGVDAFIVNVAIPTIAVELHASAAQIEAVIAIYLIAYATLVITGGRLGDIYGTRNVYSSPACSASHSPRCGAGRAIRSGAHSRPTGAGRDSGADGAAGARHPASAVYRSARARAFGIYGIVLGLAGAAGFMLGGVLVTLDVAGLGWRVVFFVNVPFGVIIIAAALKIMPMVPRRAGTRLDIQGRSCCSRDCSA